MARAQWPLLHDRPVVQVVLTFPQGGQKVTRTVLADTGAAGLLDPFEFVFDEVDCLLCGGKPFKSVFLGGSYSGRIPSTWFR